MNFAPGMLLKTLSIWRRTSNLRPVAFIVHESADGKISPVVFDSPHSGLILPNHFQYSCAYKDLLRLSDLHVDRLLADVPAQNVPVLEAQTHRAVIDLNRYEYELDPAELRTTWTRASTLTAPTLRGRGLIPVTTPNLTRIYDDARRPSAEDVTRRIDGHHRPYHAEVKKRVDRAHEQNGIAIHCNIHSMRRNTEGCAADIVLGDLHGRSCTPEIRDFAKDFFERAGLSVALNEPFAGAALIQTTQDPSAGRHSLQIEIVRDLYMDPQTLAFNAARGTRLRGVMARFAGELGSFSRGLAPG